MASGVPALVLFSIGGIAGKRRQSGVRRVGGVDAVRLRPVVHLRGDRRAVSQQVGRRVGLRRGGVAEIQQADRAAVGLVQLAGVDARALARAARSPLDTSSTRSRRFPRRSRPAVQQWLASNGGGTAADARGRADTGNPLVDALDATVLGVHLSIGATFFIGVVLTLIVFAIQHRGISGTARVQLILGLMVILPMLICRHRAVFQRQRDTAQIFRRSCHWPRRRVRRPARGTAPDGRSCSVACSSPRGRPTPSRPRSATPANSRIRAATRSKRSSRPACCASSSSRSCRSRFRGFSA